MKTLLIGELVFLVALVIGCMATLDRPLTSLRAWCIAFGAGMLLWFFGVQAMTLDVFWLKYLALAMGAKIIGIVLLLQDRMTQRRQVKLGAIADASKRNFVSTLSNLCRNLDSGGAPGGSAEVPATESSTVP